MKTVLLTVALLTSQVTFASIKNSENDSHHQYLMEIAIEQNCGVMRDLTQVSQTEIVTRVDSGIFDRNYTTVINGVKRLDQGIFDTYKITVESERADMFDHTTGNWGSYLVTSVFCDQQ